MSSEEPHSRQSDSYQSSLPDPWPILNDSEKSFARTFVGMGFPTPRVARAVQRLGTNEKEVRSRFFQEKTYSLVVDGWIHLHCTALM